MSAKVNDKTKMNTTNGIKNICKKEEEDVLDDLSATLSWLDKKFVQKILSNDLNSDQLMIDHMDVERAVPKGDNYASLMVRVFIEYRQHQKDLNTKKMTLIIKSLPEGLFQNWVKDIGAFVKEARMFEETLPAMYKLAKERTGEEMEPLATRVYRNDRPDTIVLEDLRPRGYRMASRREGLDLKHSVLALRTLGKFHGLSVALHVEDPTVFEKYNQGMWSEENKYIMDGFIRSVTVPLVPLVRTWPGFNRFEEKVKDIEETGMTRAVEMTKNRPGSMRVLNHGDFWVNNMMFRYDKDGNVEDVKMVDLQMMFFGSPALDITYFLSNSINQQVLEDHREELLEQYHDALCDTMRRMGCDQDLFISLEHLHQEMEDKAYIEVIVSCLLCFMFAEKDQVPDFSEVTQEEMDNGKTDAMKRAISNKHYLDVFQRRLLIFEKRGII